MVGFGGGEWVLVGGGRGCCGGLCIVGGWIGGIVGGGGKDWYKVEGE